MQINACICKEILELESFTWLSTKNSTKWSRF